MSGTMVESGELVRQKTGRVRLAHWASAALVVAALLGASLIGSQPASAQSSYDYWASDYCYYVWDGTQYLQDGCYLGPMYMLGGYHHIYAQFRGNWNLFYSYELRYHPFAYDTSTGHYWYSDGRQWMDLTQALADQNAQGTSQDPRGVYADWAEAVKRQMDINIASIILSPRCGTEYALC